jgi:cytochrome c peroxidase
VIRPSLLALSLAHALVLGACTGESGTVSDASPPPRASASAAGLADLAAPLLSVDAQAPAHPPVRVVPLSLAARAGKQIFFDKSLSASKAMSCATCHDPEFAYGPPNDLAVQLGGPKGTSPGLRAVPSIRYKEYTPGYADLLDNPDGFSRPGPGGGYAWDGRADSLHDQAKAPLLSPFEMANTNGADVVAKLRASPSATSFLQAFGDHVFDDAATAFEDVTMALQAFQLEDPSFHPYSSKYDLHLREKPEGAFTPAEERGFQVFVDPKKGNCTGCHLHAAGTLDGSDGMFTDYSYEAIGVPRNTEIPANRSNRYFDMGICGPVRSDHLPKDASFGAFCGLFKTPTLRNAATRHVFFHNGIVHSLEQAVRFYNTRDTMPELWYPTVGGRPKAVPDPGFPRYGLVTTQYVGGVVQKYDDLPAAYRGNIDRQIPLDGRAIQSQPPMTDQEVLDLVCFLETLTDDYKVAPPPASGRCVR